jgi:hypothetical protein
MLVIYFLRDDTPLLIVISTAGRDLPTLRLTVIHQQNCVEISHFAADSRWDKAVSPSFVLQYATSEYYNWTPLYRKRTVIRHCRQWNEMVITMMRYRHLPCVSFLIILTSSQKSTIHVKEFTADCHPQF